MDDRNKKFLAIGVGLAAAAVCCAIALIVFVVLDPFGWFGGLLGGRDPIVRAIPEDTDVYLGLNMGQLLSSDAEAVLSTIIESVPGGEMRDFEDMLDEMVEELFYEYDLSFSSDISPWIGQHLGISLSNLSFDPYGDVVEPDIIIAVEVRNRDAADDFIADYIDAYEREWDEAFQADVYRGADVYELDGRYQRQAVCRSGNVLIFGNSAFAVESAIDAQWGDSLADDPDFESISARFPNRRFATIYIGPGFAQSYMDLAGAFGQGPVMAPDAFSAFALTVSFTDYGLQLDSFMSTGEGGADALRGGLLDGTGMGGDLISMMPEDTVGFFVGQRLDMIWEGIEESMELAYGGDFNEAMLFFFEEFGIRPDTDLFPILDGEWAIVLLAGSNSSLGRELGGMSLLLLAESSEEEEIEALTSDMAWGLERSGLDVREIEESGGVVYIMQEGGDEYFSFGAQGNVLFIGTDSDFLLEIMEGGSSIEDDRAYREVWDAFPRGTTPVLYLDINSLLEGYMDLEDINWETLAWEIGIDPRPYTHIAAGSGGFSRESIRATIVIFINTD